MRRPHSVLAAGYVVLDVVLHEGGIRHRAGGTAANVAANLAYFGWSAQLLARLGQDPRARRIIHDLRTSGVDSSHIERDNAVETPVVIHEVRPPEHRFRFVCPECNQRLPTHRPPTADQVEVWAEKGIPTGHPDIYFFDRASAPALELAARLRDAGSLVVFEPSSGAVDRTIRGADMAHIVKCSAERRAFMPDALLAARPDQLQIETMGADGLRFRIGAGRWRILQAPETEVLDSAGAGDWLTSAFLRSLQTLELSDESAIASALQLGQAVAAFSCRYAGARAASGVSSAVLLRDAKRAVRGGDVKQRALRQTRRSRAANACPTCLGLIRSTI